MLLFKEKIVKLFTYTLSMIKLLESKFLLLNANLLRVLLKICTLPALLVKQLQQFSLEKLQRLQATTI